MVEEDIDEIGDPSWEKGILDEGLKLTMEYLMRKRGSWGRKKSHRTSRTTSNSSTSAKRHQGAFCVIVGRNHLGKRRRRISLGRDRFSSGLNLIGSGRQGVLTARSGRSWTL